MAQVTNPVLLQELARQGIDSELIRDKMKPIFAWFPITVTAGLWAGIMAQFIWKMIYFPEPLVPVILELIGFSVITGLAIWIQVRQFKMLMRIRSS